MIRALAPPGPPDRDGKATTPPGPGPPPPPVTGTATARIRSRLLPAEGLVIGVAMIAHETHGLDYLPLRGPAVVHEMRVDDLLSRFPGPHVRLQCRLDKPNLLLAIKKRAHDVDGSERQSDKSQGGRAVSRNSTAPKEPGKVRCHDKWQSDPAVPPRESHVVIEPGSPPADAERDRGCGADVQEEPAKSGVKSATERSIRGFNDDHDADQEDEDANVRPKA